MCANCAAEALSACSHSIAATRSPLMPLMVDCIVPFRSHLYAKPLTRGWPSCTDLPQRCSRRLPLTPTSDG